MSNTFNRFIAHPRIKKTLNTKPGEEGFSLIELVVVVAVLAILAAVALPNFLGVQKDAQVATAKNTLATIVKECVTSSLRGTGTSWASIQSTQGKINGFTLASLAGTCFFGEATGDGDLANYAISYSTTDGSTAKTCTTSASDYVAGCFSNASLTTTVTAGNAGSW